MEFEVGKELPKNYEEAFGMNVIGNNNFVTKVEWQSKKLLLIHCLIGMLFEVHLKSKDFQVINKIRVVVTDKRNFNEYIASCYKWVLSHETLHDEFDVPKCYLKRLVRPSKFNDYVEHYKKYCRKF